MENMWLIAQSLGIAFHIISDFGGSPVEDETKRIINIPGYVRIAFGCCLGYPIFKPARRLRVCRGMNDFTHHNKSGNTGLAERIPTLLRSLETATWDAVQLLGAG